MNAIIAKTLPCGKVEVVAVVNDKDRAHMVAECISYVENKSSLYGLFGMRIYSAPEFLAESDANRLAWCEFQGSNR